MAVKVVWCPLGDGGDDGGPILDRAGNPPPTPCELKTAGGHVCGNWPIIDKETGLWGRPGCWECY